MKVGSLFSGVGGIEIGFEKQGFETQWCVEFEPYAKTILKKRFPSAKIYDDITKIDFEAVPKVDILTGGFPCQDISNAGKGVGITGSRSSLWKYYFKAIRILRPRIALIENVAALTKKGLNVVLGNLAEIGYDAEWYNISASAVGANHQRERIFIIAYPNGNRESDVPFDEGQRQRVVDEVFNTYNNGQPSSKEQESIIKRSNSSKTRESETIKFKRPSSESRNVEQLSHSNNSRQQREGKDEIRQELFCSREYSWSTEPELGRVADGISNRVDRIKCLGNAVVPQCAEVFAEAIKEYEMKLTSFRETQYNG